MDIGFETCDIADCNGKPEHVITHDTIEGTKQGKYCNRHKDLVMRSDTAVERTATTEETEYDE